MSCATSQRLCHLAARDSVLVFAPNFVGLIRDGRSALLCVRSEAYWRDALRILLEEYKATSEVIEQALLNFSHLCRSVDPREAARLLAQEENLSLRDDSRGLGLLADGPGARPTLFWGGLLAKEGFAPRLKLRLRYAARLWTSRTRQLRVAALSASLAALCGLVASIACVASASLLSGQLQSITLGLLGGALSPSVAHLLASRGIFYGQFFGPDVQSWADVRRCLVVFLVPNVLLLLQRLFPGNDADAGLILLGARDVLGEISRSNGALLARQAELLAAFANHVTGLGLTATEADVSLGEIGQRFAETRRAVRTLTLASTPVALLAALFGLAGQAVLLANSASFWSVARRSGALLKDAVFLHGRRIWSNAALVSRHREAVLKAWSDGREKRQLWDKISGIEAEDIGRRAPNVPSAGRAVLDALSNAYDLEIAQVIDASPCEALPSRVKSLADEWLRAGETLLPNLSALAELHAAPRAHWPRLLDVADSSQYTNDSRS